MFLHVSSTTSSPIAHSSTAITAEPPPSNRSCHPWTYLSGNRPTNEQYSTAVTEAPPLGKSSTFSYTTDAIVSTGRPYRPALRVG